MQLSAVFVSIFLCVFCGMFAVPTALDAFLLASPWCAWLLFSLVTEKIGNVGERWGSLVAHLVSVTMILLTYTKWMRTHKTMLALTALVFFASVFFFPRMETDAFKVGPVDMSLHVSLYCVTFCVTTYFDALMGERISRCKHFNEALIRALRIGWLLFVENYLLFALVLQLLCLFIHLHLYLCDKKRSKHHSEKRKLLSSETRQKWKEEEEEEEEKEKTERAGEEEETSPGDTACCLVDINKSRDGRGRGKAASGRRKERRRGGGGGVEEEEKESDSDDDDA